MKKYLQCGLAIPCLIFVFTSSAETTYQFNSSDELSSAFVEALAAGNDIQYVWSPSGGVGAASGRVEVIRNIFTEAFDTLFLNSPVSVPPETSMIFAFTATGGGSLRTGEQIAEMGFSTDPSKRLYGTGGTPSYQLVAGLGFVEGTTSVQFAIYNQDGR